MEFEFKTFHVACHVPSVAKDTFGIKLSAAIDRMQREHRLAALFVKEGMLQAYIVRNGANLSVDTNLVVMPNLQNA